MSTKMSLSGVDAGLVQFQANLAQKTAGFVVGLVDAAGNSLGSVQIQVGPQAQPETPTQEAIPAFDDLIQQSPKAQALYKALAEFGLELVDTYSKTLTVTEAEEA